ncbi:hypothetical protein DXG03_001363 [Asterophora parasitica]|uniref:Uncharacterized protein n=1 Tax=Asterophora parasitica TaxID=117018 RepID=A0A9P7KCU9_9AGAR|nr:hypothetical protein DXG03_001363 [Asterophora parasitica]
MSTPLGPGGRNIVNDELASPNLPESSGSEQRQDVLEPVESAMRTTLSEPSNSILGLTLVANPEILVERWRSSPSILEASGSGHQQPKPEAKEALARSDDCNTGNLKLQHSPSAYALQPVRWSSDYLHAIGPTPAQNVDGLGEGQNMAEPPTARSRPMRLSSPSQTSRLPLGTTYTGMDRPLSSAAPEALRSGRFAPIEAAMEPSDSAGNNIHGSQAESGLETEDDDEDQLVETQESVGFVETQESVGFIYPAPTSLFGKRIKTGQPEPPEASGSSTRGPVKKEHSWGSQSQSLPAS